MKSATLCLDLLNLQKAIVETIEMMRIFLVQQM